MSSDSRGSRRDSGLRLPVWALVLLIVLGLLLLTLSSVWLFRTVRGLASESDGTGADFNPVPDQVDSGPNAPEVEAGTIAAPGGQVAPESIAGWSGMDRVNILLLGVDLRCDEEGPTHSDTIIVATIDPVSQSAALLSLPRDLWVEIPDFGVNRINQAYFLGQAYELPGGGAALAVETVEAFLGVPIDWFEAELRRETATLSERYPGRYHRYLIDGMGHTAIVAGTITGVGDSTAIFAWLGQFLNHDAAWTDVEQPGLVD